MQCFVEHFVDEMTRTGQEAVEDDAVTELKRKQ